MLFSPHNVFVTPHLHLGIYTFLSVGLKAYQFLRSNIGLPSEKSIYNWIEAEEKFIEGEIRAEQLSKFLTERKLKRDIWLSEDATKTIVKVKFDAKINQYVGFSLPLAKNGVPKKMSFPASSATAILNHLESAEKSSYLYVIMAVVLDNSVKVPAFCLSAWGTNNRFSADQVYRRTVFIVEELKKYDINVVGFSSDGDTRLLKVQKFVTGLGSKSNRNVPDTFMNFYDAKMDMILFSVQDVVHRVNKMKNRIFQFFQQVFH